MKRLCIFASVLFVASAVQARVVENIDFDWAFFQGDIDGAEKLDFNDSHWRTLDVPHDWSIEGEYSPDNTPQN